MIEFIVGATAGIYAYKRIATVRKFIDFEISNKIDKFKDYLFDRKYKIVTFGVDKYAIRVNDFFGNHRYISVRASMGTSWGVTYPEYYIFDSLAKCEEMFKAIKDNERNINNKYGTPI